MRLTLVLALALALLAAPVAAAHHPDLAADVACRWSADACTALRNGDAFVDEYDLVTVEEQIVGPAQLPDVEEIDLLPNVPKPEDKAETANRLLAPLVQRATALLP